MTKNRKILYGILVIAALVVLGLSWYFSNKPPAPSQPPIDQPATSTSPITSCEELEAQINSLIEEANHCVQDDDCVVKSPDFLVCPFGNYLLLNNKADIRQIEEAVKRYSADRCMLCNYEPPDYPEPEDIKCRGNKCVDIRSEKIEQEITITTDKTEYRQEETVEVVVINGFDKPIYFLEFSIYKEIDTKWNPLRLSLGACPPPLECVEPPDLCSKLAAGESINWQWSQKFYEEYFLSAPEKDATSGNYKVTFCYSTEKNEPKGKDCELMNAICVERKFTITEK